ncbi:MAG TPA: glycoside hydrolase family 11 protein [Polyangia bacterium]|nr:glycoside hydrolase family 11 protein [Polyangia bacterium]
MVLTACAQSESVSGQGGSGGTSTGTGGEATGGTTAEGGSPGSTGTGGFTSTGGLTGTGGVFSTGGATGTGGAKGGSSGTGGLLGTGGGNTGGATGTGGLSGTGGAKGGSTGTGGLLGNGGTTGTGGAKGGSTGTGGTAAGGVSGTGGSAGGSGTTVDCNTALPSGGTMHTGDTQGTAAGLSWQLWANGSGGSITTFSVPAFSAAWNNSGDFLARTGLEWGSGKAVSSLGTVTAQFTETKSGNAGGYSYIGIYGWSVNPCIEWYIVDDSYNKMPVNPGSTTNKGTVTIDGGSYTLYTRPTTGTGGNRCGNVSNWTQFYSVRQTARTCGQISISDHFSAWASAGMTLGSVLEASILMEAGGGSGSINFPVANVTAQ